VLLDLGVVDRETHLWVLVFSRFSRNRRKARLQLRLRLDHRADDLRPCLLSTIDNVAVAVRNGGVEGGVGVGASDVRDGDEELLRARVR
jgi:hypothetical protein